MRTELINGTSFLSFFLGVALGLCPGSVLGLASCRTRARLAVVAYGERCAGMRCFFAEGRSCMRGRGSG
jgi:hypothetical protein